LKGIRAEDRRGGQSLEASFPFHHQQRGASNTHTTTNLRAITPCSGVILES